ncbi:MAG: hypothetical protein EXR72_10055 [Myxococcales bacterium]|nr:hypothetical protein [Myxococcales bacterium]
MTARNVHSLAALLLAIAGCNQTTIQTPIRSLDRPSDVALVCATWSADGGVMTQPLADCAPDGGVAGAALFVLTPNTTRGELALVAGNTTSCSKPEECPAGYRCIEKQCETSFGKLLYRTAQIIDLDLETPGYGFVPLGVLPEHMRTTDDGCRAVSANTGGCDLTVVDVPKLLAVPAKNSSPQFLASLARHVVPNVNKVPLGARATWIEISPPLTARGPADITQCQEQEDTHQYRALVAFPGCQLVGEIDLKSGEILHALQVTRQGARVVDPATIHCPSECSGIAPGPEDAGAPQPLDFALAVDAGKPQDAGVTDLKPVVDATVPDAAAPDAARPPLLPATKAYPSTLAVQIDRDAEGTLLASSAFYVGDAAGDGITVVPLAPLPKGGFGLPREIPLAEHPGGVSVLRLSPPLQVGGKADPLVRYLYAIARDRTVRVVDVGKGMECETNPDVAALNGAHPIIDADGGVTDLERVILDLRCLPVGKTARSATAATPGISLPGDALPRDVAFVHLTNPPDATSPNTAGPAKPELMVGDFAWIFDSQSRPLVVNLVDRCPQPNLVDLANNQSAPDLVFCAADRFRASIKTALAEPGRPLPLASDLMPNRLRRGNPRFATGVAEGSAVGAPRLADLPQVTTFGGALDAFDRSHAGLCNVFLDGFKDAAGVVHTPTGCADIPPSVIPPANPLVAPANFLALSDPDGVSNETWFLSWEGLLPATPSTAGSVAGTTFQDVGGAFCARDVEEGDKLLLNGCIEDFHCRPTQQCFHDPGAPDASSGLCLPRDATFAEAQERCKPWTRGLLRYHIGKDIHRTALTLVELPEPEFRADTRGCAEDADCSSVTVQGVVAGNQVALPTVCLRDPRDGLKRCLRACTPRADDDGSLPTRENVCGSGFTCAESSEGGFRCLRAQVPHAMLTKFCFAELQAYEIHVGDAFFVRGGTTLLSTPRAVAPDTGLCVDPPPLASGANLLSPRLPIDASPCPEPPGPAPHAGASQANWLGPVATGAPNTCRLAPLDPCHIYLHYENPIFRTVVDIPARGLASGMPTPDGGAGAPDGGVPGGCAEAVSRVPAENTVISFSTLGGFRVLAGSLGAQLPRSSQVGPDGKTVYVVDEGRQSIGSGLRGQVIKFLSENQVADTTFIVR